MASVDLGKSYSDAPYPATTGEDEDKKFYPSVSIPVKDLPKSGKITFEFKRVRTIGDDKNGEDLTEIELQKYCGCEGGESKEKKSESGEEALDRLAGKSKKEPDEDEDEYEESGE